MSFHDLAQPQQMINRCLKGHSEPFFHRYLSNTMTIFRYFPAVILALFAGPTLAADANGYTAKYECRAGGPNCNVDVAALGNRTCDQIVSTSTPWSSINWSKNTICIEAGDHTSKGTLTIPSSASGTAGNYKVLRYALPGEAASDDEPWNQGVRAKIQNIDLKGSYWVLHRLTLDGNGATLANYIYGNNNIASRVLVQNYGAIMFYIYGGDGNTVQNSVFRDTLKKPNEDSHCIDMGGYAYDTHIINNEIYDCAGDGFQTSAYNLSLGLVIENNDIYQTTAMYTDGNGNLTPTGNYSCGENALDLKNGGSAANPLRVIHNRTWGFRMTDTDCGSNAGSGGDAIIFHNNPTFDPYATSYGIIQNNIIFDVPYAIGSPNQTSMNWSVIGNLIYDSSHSGYSPAYAIEIAKANKSEVYLNTIISSTSAISIGGGGSNDARCNLTISSGVSNGTASQFNNNAYYDSPNGSEAVSISVPVATRASATDYYLGQIIRTSESSKCVTGTESACFLYRVTRAGTSASGPQSYCTTLGCPQQDGTTLQLQAIRGPYTFYYKLRTSPKPYTIPYARAYVGAADAPEANACPSTYAARPGVGINDVN